MTQVNADNVLAVHRAFQQHADDLLAYLQQTSGSFRFDPCGGDPVSQAVLRPDSFGGKIEKLFEVHWKHWEELDAVASNLRDAALAYGHTESEISQSLSGQPTR